MIRSLHTAATGLAAQQFMVDVTSNNLANVNTTGFKRSRADFEALFYEHLTSPGSPATEATEHPTGVSVGSGVRTASTQKLFLQGGQKKTENPLDFSIQGDGFFQVLKPDGTTAYTRDGSFQMDGEGNVVTSNGLFLEPQIQIPEQATEINVRADGTVSVKIAGEPNPQQVGQIQLAKFVNPAGLSSTGNNLLMESTASGPPQVVAPGVEGAGEIRQGFIETANVDVTEELVNLISAQRAFEFNHRSIRTADQMLARVATLLR